MAEPAVAALVEKPVEPSTTIPIVFLCPACKQNLQGLGFDAACRQCGKNVRESLPAGATLRFYQLRPERAAASATRWACMVGLQFAVTIGVALIIIALSGGYDSNFWTQAALGTTVAILIPLAQRRGIAIGLQGYALVVGEDDLICFTKDALPVRLSRQTTRRIEERPGRGILVIGASRMHAVGYSTLADGYSQLREHLSTWAPVHPRRWPWLNPVGNDLACLFAALMLSGSGRGIVVAALGLFVAAVSAIRLYRRVQAAPSLSGPKRRAVFLLALLIAALCLFLLFDQWRRAHDGAWPPGESRLQSGEAEP